MKKVYLVWQRDYDDTLNDEVLKIFDSKEKAEDYVNKWDESEGVFWEERNME